MPRNIRAEAASCYFSSGPESQQWWDIALSQWTRGPEPGDTVDFNSQDIYVDVNIDLRQLSISGQPNALYVSSDCVVHSGSLFINYNAGIVHLHGGTVGNNYGTLYAYDLGCIINNNHGPVYLLSRQGARVGGSGPVIPRIPLMVWT